MRFLLSYAHMAVFSSESMPITSRVESSVRKLFGRLVDSRGFYAASNASAQNQFPQGYEQVPRSPGKNIKMKASDWICPRCSFINFARNFKCCVCEQPRPKKFLTGAEWECPWCDFFNFSRNAVCIRCDCKKPVLNPSQSLNPALWVRGQNSSIEGCNIEEQQQLFTNKIAQLEKSSDVSGSREDSSSPESMQSGDDSFAVDRNMCIDGSVDGVDPQTTGANINMEISQYLDEVLNQGSTADMSDISVPLSESKHPGRPKLTYFPVHEQLKYNPASQMENTDTEQAKKSEEWFKKVAQLHDVEDLPSAISDEDFPEIMPMRRGENRFVVSKKKDRSLISPMYKRRMAMEQEGGSNKYVPFVPFPPGCFARDKPQDGSDSRISSPDNGDKESTPSQQSGALSLNSRTEEKATNPVDNSSNNMELTQRSSDLCSSPSGSSGTSLKGDSCGSSESKTIWRGRSLEGSAVKEPDPLDMSEEAKAERWFRSVAKIKDISELSQIPDEDFPSIMPMRKGVNRFVVSKRKTPLERRLTSSQYRQNPPVVNSNPPTPIEDMPTDRTNSSV